MGESRGTVVAFKARRAGAGDSGDDASDDFANTVIAAIGEIEDIEGVDDDGFGGSEGAGIGDDVIGSHPYGGDPGDNVDGHIGHDLFDLRPGGEEQVAEGIGGEVIDGADALDASCRLVKR